MTTQTMSLAWKLANVRIKNAMAKFQPTQDDIAEVNEWLRAAIEKDPEGLDTQMLEESILQYITPMAA
jgi:hypothetical protein